jgi:hypothetical protein
MTVLTSPEGEWLQESRTQRTQKWTLLRAREYLEAYLDKPITLGNANRCRK